MRNGTVWRFRWTGGHAASVDAALAGTTAVEGCPVVLCGQAGAVWRVTRQHRPYGDPPVVELTLEPISPCYVSPMAPVLELPIPDERLR